VIDRIQNRRAVLLVPDKDADGLSAGYVLHKTLTLMGLPADHIYTHVLSKGTNVHSASEIATMEALIEQHGIERAVVLDQGSRPGAIVSNLRGEGGGRRGLMVIDHHQSREVRDIIATRSQCPRIANAIVPVPTRIHRPDRLQHVAHIHHLLAHIPHMFAAPPSSSRANRLGSSHGRHWRPRSRYQMGRTTLARSYRTDGKKVRKQDDSRRCRSDQCAAKDGRV
jgi:hypothetical protein